MEGWVGLVVDSLPTKWSFVNHRLDAGQGKVYWPETDVLATDLRRQHVSCLLCVVRPAQECQKIFKAQLSMDRDVGRTKVCQYSLEKFFFVLLCVFISCCVPRLYLVCISQKCIYAVFPAWDRVSRWLEWLGHWTCDWRSRVQSQPLLCRVPPWTSCLHTFAFVTKQYN